MRNQGLLRRHPFEVAKTVGDEICAVTYLAGEAENGIIRHGGREKESKVRDKGTSTGSPKLTTAGVCRCPMRHYARVVGKARCTDSWQERTFCLSVPRSTHSHTPA